MKRLVFLMAFLTLILNAPSALADDNSGSNAGNCSAGCSAGSAQSQDQNYPPPYTGGAPVAKVFHLSDGSTMTITTTGAVVKQSRNATPYRQGWINPADIGHINSFEDIRGRLASGDTNPYVKDSRTMANQAKYSSTGAKSTAPSHPATAAYTAARPQTAAVQPAAAAKTLPETGADAVIPLVGVITILSTLGHYIYTRRQGAYF